MERRDDNDMSAIAMPGFIDILSTVIIMFVFFVTVIAVMLYIHTIKFKAEVVAQSKQEVSEEVKAYLDKIQQGEIEPDDMQEIVDLSTKKAEMEQEVNDLSQDIKQIKSQYAQSGSDQRTESYPAQRVFVVYFDKNAITLSDGADAKLKDFLAEIGVTAGEARYKLSTRGGPSAPTGNAAREIGLARMLNVRNGLLKQGAEAQAVGVSYEEDSVPDGGYNWVKVTVTGE